VKKSLSLVVSVYNAVRYLELIFAALKRQSMSDFEVIVADDGSGAAVRDLIERIKVEVPYPVRHVWQSDEGFRKNSILNRAIEASKTDYLVFIDGDCLPHGEFLNDHLSNKTKGCLLSGRRVNLSAQMTERLRLEEISSGAFERLSFRLLLDGALAKSSNLEDALRIKSSPLRKLLHRNRARILGCNFSVEKKLLEEVNGFDEDYRSPGLGEDSDIAFRMELAGARLVTLRYLAVLFHLYHPQTIASEANRLHYESVVAARIPVCRHGLRNLDSKGAL